MMRVLFVSAMVVALGVGCGGAGETPAGSSTGSGGAGGASGTGGTGGGAPPDTTFDGSSSCQSASFYVGHQGTDMRPGEACVACHTLNHQGSFGPPIFTFAGTVFSEGHALNHCLPTADETTALKQAQVVITGADGTQLTLPLSLNTLSGEIGNFSTTKTLQMPYTAKVVYAGKERAMTTPQSTGDCNSCHTVTGANGAPGRIALPQ
jgi:hypothetical protein